MNFRLLWKMSNFLRLATVSFWRMIPLIGITYTLDEHIKKNNHKMNGPSAHFRATNSFPWRYFLSLILLSNHYWWPKLEWWEYTSGGSWSYSWGKCHFLIRLMERTVRKGNRAEITTNSVNPEVVIWTLMFFKTNII